MRQEKGKMIQPTTSFMFVENVKQVVKHALMILLALHLIIGHLGNLILIQDTMRKKLPKTLDQLIFCKYTLNTLKFTKYLVNSYHQKGVKHYVLTN